MLTPEALEEQLNWRYATKKFDTSRSIPTEHWATLENSLVLAPSSFGLQPWKFVVVDDSAIREQLKAASFNQKQITDATRLVVFAGKRTMTRADIDRFLSRTNEVRGTPLEALARYREMLIGFVENGWPAADIPSWNARQVYIALGQFMTSAAALGIDTCPMEGIDMPTYDRLLGLQDSDYTTLVACPVGYRHADDNSATMPKIRYSAADLIERR